MKFKSESFNESDQTTIVSFDWNGNPCEWWSSPTGNSEGNDNHMKYEVKFTLYVGGKLVVQKTRYISEYSDNKIEFQNTTRLLIKSMSEEKFQETISDVIPKMSY